MATPIIPLYKCSQKDLYSIIETAWQNYENKLTDFTNHKGLYNAAYKTQALLEVARAKALPDADARSTVAETLRVGLVDLGKVCLKNFNKLKSYIETAFVNEALWEIQFEGAGQNYYAAAANQDWDSMDLLMQSGKNYLDLNNTLLLGVPPMLNMPPTFADDFNNGWIDFGAQYLAFKNAEETSELTAEKVRDNNDCFKKAMDMMRDGQLIFSDSVEVKKLFVFSTIWDLINPPVSGVKGVVKVAGSNVPLGGATVTTQKTGGVAQSVETDADGKFSVLLSKGDFVIRAVAAGFVAQETSVTLDASGYRTFDFLLVGE